MLSPGEYIGQLIPPACAGCDGAAAPDDAFCAICRPTAYRLRPPYCDRCRVPMEQFDAPDVNTNSLCSRCQRRPPAFRDVSALWEYEGAVADAIRRIKYASDFPALRALCRKAGSWLSDVLAPFAPAAPLVPVPSHPDELRRRGFHLPSLFLRLLRNHRNGHRVESLLQKVRPTARQASLPPGARHQNVAEAFGARRRVDGGTAIVFDDVLTTGATADAASRALLDAGFDEVAVIVVARAPLAGRC